ncbi:MAG: helix-turn-helix transcriptional regulator [Firmicutes bacterium]|nr:helix-turn-helix transcriptional regulator [Candidatus Colimorpha enterica]
MKTMLHTVGDFECLRSSVENGHVCKTENGFDYAQIRLILHGTCGNASAGDALYIPAHTGYSLTWKGEQGAEYYTLEFRVGSEISLLSEIRIFSDDELLPLFKRLETAISECDTLSSASLFFAILSVSFPSIKRVYSSNERIMPAVAYIGEHLSENFSVGFLSKLCYLSESRFFCLFKAEMGMSPIDYRNELRIQRAEFNLSDGHSIEDVSEMLGFCSPAYFRRIYKKYSGTNPGRNNLHK